MRGVRVVRRRTRVLSMLLEVDENMVGWLVAIEIVVDVESCVWL